MISATRLAELQEKGAWFPVSDRAVIEITGTDRVRYLNGQVSQDLRSLSEKEVLPALVLTAKGKLCAVVAVWSEGDRILVETDAELGETLLARLERYAIADDVTFTLLEVTPALVHVIGPLREEFGGREHNRIGCPGRDATCSPEGGLQASAEEVEALRIIHGRARWNAELSEDTLPQEAKLEQFAVSFTKGCYVGQEIVSRLKSVGRVNRLLQGFRGENLTPGLILRNATGDKVGHLTSVCGVADSGPDLALGYLSSREEGAEFSAFDESGACLGRAERCEFPLSLS